MDSGTCGRNLTWTLDDNGTLTISEKGVMSDYSWRYERSFIQTIIIDKGLTTIGNFAFILLTSLKEIIIPNSVERIGKEAFSNCNSLTNITIPNSVRFIGKEPFHDCASLQKIYYPAGRGFEKNLSAGNNAQLIPYEKLWWKVEGKTLTVGGVSEIKAYSYEETPWRDSLNDIQRIIIDDGIEKISARAFEECRRLELLTIPASVKTIGDMAFSFCYCGNGLANGGRNVYWTLEDGVLNLKKNPDVRDDADFSTGAITWLVLDKNITGIKLEAGVVPKEKFFEWLGKRSNAMQIAFG